MTLQSLRYIVEIAKHKSFSKAASTLYMTQSALSASVKDIENELGIQIFLRTNRGIKLTPDGEDCLTYCKEIVERSDRLSARYKNRGALHTYFSVSTQHLPFAVRAFNELLETTAPIHYHMAIYEVSTAEVLEHVAANKSEVGVLAVPEDHLRLLHKSFYAKDLFFVQTAQLCKYVFLRRNHPLGNRDSLTIEQLKPYPFVTYDRMSAPIYYTEEIVFYEPLDRCIHVSDRATKMSVIRTLDAFSIGIDLPNFNRDIYFKDSSTELIAIPFVDQSDSIIVGYLEKNGHVLSENGSRYVELLSKHIQKLALPGIQ